MRLVYLSLIVWLPLFVYAMPAVDVEGSNDTIVKFKYTGGNPNSTTHPAALIQGKALGLKAIAQATDGAAAIIGSVSGSTLPNPAIYYSHAGVLASGDFGVMAKGGSYGVFTEGGSYGVVAEGYHGIYAEGSTGVYGVGGDFGGYFDGDVYTTGEYFDGSDLALKQNIRPLDKGLGIVMSLEPKAYEMKSGVTRAKSGTRFGLIAQNVEGLLPEVVRNVKSPIKKNSNGLPVEGGEGRQEFKALNYTALIPILIKAIQEQQQRIDALEAQLQER